MKSAAFDYHAPRAMDDALALLARHAEDGRVLAGGQSLVPAMAYRMARPAVLVDINRIAGLDHATVADDWLRIGALARHARFETPIVPGPLGVLLADVARHIAHAPIRQRGTFCGSLAHADPASEWCATVLALGGEMIVRGAGGERRVAARDWFQGVFTTALRPGEMLVETRVPQLGADWRCGFAEMSRRAGDFALALAVVALRMDGARIAEARVALGGIAGTPVLAEDAARLLTGETPDARLYAAVADTAAQGSEPHDDIHADAAYRRDLVRVVVRRALLKASPP